MYEVVSHYFQFHWGNGNLVVSAMSDPYHMLSVHPGMMVPILRTGGLFCPVWSAVSLGLNGCDACAVRHGQASYIGLLEPISFAAGHKIRTLRIWRAVKSRLSISMTQLGGLVLSNRLNTLPVAPQSSESDKLEETLVRAHGFLEEALRVRRESRSVTDDRIEYHPRGWREAARRLLLKVNREYVLVSSGISVCSTSILDIQQQNVRELVAQGVRVRHLFTPQALEHGTIRHYADTVSRHGAEVRVSNRHIHDAIIVDGLAAVIWGRSAFFGEQCLSIKGTVMLESLCRTLGAVWDAAPGLRTYLHWHGTEAARTTREIVELLYAGCKDESAARQLGISVRTFRRRVAEILRQLDAESRFQAGAKAVQLGLIPNL